MSLDRSTAEERSALIRAGSISYQFNLVLTTSQYYGLAEINFYLENTNFTDLKVDFQCYQIQQMVVNSLKILPASTKNFVSIPRLYLQKGRNRVTITYINKYDRDRIGCMTFFDSADQYIYTGFEPYAAHRVFPCFDQPNLKAPMRIAITAPSNWTVISNQPVQAIRKHNSDSLTPCLLINANDYSTELFQAFMSKASNNSQVTIFDYTELISTYLYAFAAGPFEYVDYPANERLVPMRFYSVASSIDLLQQYSDFMAKVAQESMSFYEDFFGQPYAFRKFDLVFVRFCDSEGMENPGMVTMDELLMLQRYPSQEQYFYIAYQIAHELLQHWLGDLVTMNWWDDLWLKESFADFMANNALGSINNYFIRKFMPTGIYFRNKKVGAYRLDSKSTITHSIRDTVENTDVANNIFDSITSMKGAYALKQLMLIIGQENLRKVLQKYVNQFKWSNSTITDFFDNVSPYFPSSVSFTDWVNDWIKTPSFAVIEALWNPDDKSTSANLKILQSSVSPIWPTLRHHQFVEVFFFDANANPYQSRGVMFPKGTMEVDVSYDGSRGIKAILVDWSDAAFLRNMMDAQSLVFFKENILKIYYGPLRSLVWYSIAQLCEHSYLRIDDYAAFLMVKLFQQPLTYIVDKMLQNLFYLFERYLQEEIMVKQATIVFNSLNQELQKASDYERIQVLLRHYIKFAQTEEQILKLKALLTNNQLSSIPIFDRNLPWQIVKKVYSIKSMTVDEKQQLFQFVRQKDTGYRSDAARIVCDTILLNTTEQLQTVYEQLKSDTVDLTTKMHLVQGWNSRLHSDIVSTFRERYFQDLVTLGKNLSFNFFQFFYKELQPSGQSDSLISSYNTAIIALKKDASLSAHVTNLESMIEDLTLSQKVINFNSDSNLTLTQERAIARSTYIKSQSIRYLCHIGFQRLQQASTYTGFTEINFELLQVPELLPLDFVCTSLSKLVVNGNNVTPLMSGEVLLIPRIYLALGNNTIAISYSSIFNNDGLGCMAFQDTLFTPTPNQIYTQFKPDGAHRFMPCFDQPDLKAKASFSVIVPKYYIVASNESFGYRADYDQIDYIAHAPHINGNLLVNEFLSGKQGSFFVFNQTKMLPTYLFSVIAGQYRIFPYSLYKNMQIRLYSMLQDQFKINYYQYFIFEVTKLSLEFYQSTLNVPYPFSKCDFVYIYELDLAAVQTAGISIFNSYYLFQKNPSQGKMIDLGLAIARVCAHQWFGSYVTMKWWDDLWLSESFAEFMAYYCLDGIKDKVTTIDKYASGWIPAVSRVMQGFREDQLSSTRPIRSEVANTSLATAYFDKITSGKGMLILKQLMVLMGSAKFFQGVTAFLNKYAWSNATMEQFMAQMSPFNDNPAPDYSFDIWKEMWLLSASLNVLTVQWDPKSTDKKATLTIIQSPYSQQFPTLRYHMINIAFFADDGSYTTQKVLIKNQVTTTVYYDASNGVQAILLNEGLQGYFKYVMDDTSLSFFQNNINTINKGDTAQDALTRSIVWLYMNQMVVDARIKVLPFRDCVLELIPDESEDTIYQSEFSFLNQITTSLIPLQNRVLARKSIFEFLWLLLPKFPPEVNRTKIHKNLLPLFCSDQNQIQTLKQWIQGIMYQYPPTQTQSWAVVKLVYTSSRYDLDYKTLVYQSQYYSIPSRMGDQTKNTLTALSAIDTELDTIYDSFKEAVLSVGAKATYSEGWNHPVHLQQLTSKYYHSFFKDIPLLSVTLSRNHFEFFYKNLKPIDDNFQEIIASFQSIRLPESNMLGHRYNIRKIIETYKLRQRIYDYNFNA